MNTDAPGDERTKEPRAIRLTARQTRGDFRGSDLRLRCFQGLDLRAADLRGADLTGSDLSGADLRGADLRGADLTDADLTDADLTGVIATGAKGFSGGAR